MVRTYRNSDKVFIEKWMENTFHTPFSKTPFTYIFVYEEEVVKAFLDFSVMYERAEINYLYVEKKYRRKGIASSLLLEMLKFLKKERVKTITLEVSIENESAIVAYEKVGFKKIGVRSKYYDGVDAILMLKDV